MTCFIWISTVTHRLPGQDIIGGDVLGCAFEGSHRIRIQSEDSQNISGTTQVL